MGLRAEVEASSDSNVMETSTSVSRIPGITGEGSMSAWTSPLACPFRADPLYDEVFLDAPSGVSCATTSILFSLVLQTFISDIDSNFLLSFFTVAFPSAM